MMIYHIHTTYPWSCGETEDGVVTTNPAYINCPVCLANKKKEESP